jgi:putative tryptophan/tyrosine transport system substrate-binding protein
MKRKISLCLLATALLSISPFVGAQQATKVYRIGFLGGGSVSANSARIEALRQGLRELGYVEGKNIVIEYRYADAKPDRLPDLVAELVRLDVAMIVTGSTSAVLAAKQATSKIPIVAATSGDLVGAGAVRPGGNVTGLIAISPDLSGKRLELLKEIIPSFTSSCALASQSVG